jgi:hypothetical protein
MKRKIGIWGWWQGNNLGDNWILLSMKKMFGNDSLSIDTSHKDFSVFDFIICGGGGLFVNGVPDPWNGKINVRHGFLGIGTEFGASSDSISRIVSSSDFFYVRDEMTLNKFGLSDRSMISYDVTFCDPLINKESGKNIIFIWRSCDLDKVLYCKDIWKEYIGTYVSANEWRKELAKKGSIIEHSFDTHINNVYDIIKNPYIIVSQRYHGIVAAIQMGVPCIGLDICPKIRALMNECGIGEYCIKIGEIEKFNLLYEKALDNRFIIKEKMAEYTEKCNRKIIEISNGINMRFLR